LKATQAACQAGHVAIWWPTRRPSLAGRPRRPTREPHAHYIIGRLGFQYKNPNCPKSHQPPPGPIPSAARKRARSGRRAQEVECPCSHRQGAGLVSARRQERGSSRAEPPPPRQFARGRPRRAYAGSVRFRAPASRWGRAHARSSWPEPPGPARLAGAARAPRS
jgi:hypothetical protein